MNIFEHSQHALFTFNKFSGKKGLKNGEIFSINF